MSPALILALIGALPAILQFIEWLIDRGKKPTAAERDHIDDELRQLKRARRWMTLRQRRKVDPKIRKIEQYLQSIDEEE